MADHNAKVILTKASTIGKRAVRWLWNDPRFRGKRIPVGELVLLAGREGGGKSTFDCWLTAMVTRGTLQGQFWGVPRNVIVYATEDDWETTIVPRLMVAGADLERVYRIALQVDDRDSQLSLPDDLDELEAAIVDIDAAMVVISPLMSRLSRKLNTHKDAEVRLALEPLVAVANRTRCALLGLIHLNKSGGTDPLRALMASTAFPAVARAVLFIQRDPEDPSKRVLGQPKNQHGVIDPDFGGMPVFTILPKTAGTDPDGEMVWATSIQWLNEYRLGTIDEVGREDATENSLVDDCAEWLTDYLQQKGGEAPYRAVFDAAKKAGFSESMLKRSRAKAGVTTGNTATFPRSTTWKFETVTINRSHGKQKARS